MNSVPVLPTLDAQTRSLFNPVALALLCLSTLVTSGCHQHASTTANAQPGAKVADDKTLNLYNWADYIGADTISMFQEETGIKVHVAYYDSNETLRTRMLTGHSDFDVTVPSATFFQQEILSGAYLELDRTQLPNLANLDPELMRRVAYSDPNNAHGIAYLWGTVGIGYNEKKVAKALPGVSLKSWRYLFDPVYAAKLAACGINFIDEPTGVVELVLLYLGRNPDAPTARDFADVEQLLAKIRPYVRTIDTSGETEAMANGDICISLAYNGDMVQARNRANASKNGNSINYTIPEEGSLIFFTMLAIPHDAPHAANAHRFINYIMNPRVMAGVSDSVGYANAIPAATKYMDASIAGDAVVYPPLEQMKNLYVPTEGSPETTRAITRLWQRFKTGR